MVFMVWIFQKSTQKNSTFRNLKLYSLIKRNKKRPSIKTVGIIEIFKRIKFLSEDSMNRHTFKNSMKKSNLKPVLIKQKQLCVEWLHFFDMIDFLPTLSKKI